MIILYFAVAYLIIGLLFSIVFVTRLIHKVDSSALGSSWTFRMMILPGCIALWPTLLNKYKKSAAAKNE